MRVDLRLEHLDLRGFFLLLLRHAAADQLFQVALHLVYAAFQPRQLIVPVALQPAVKIAACNVLDRVHHTLERPRQLPRKYRCQHERCHQRQQHGHHRRGAQDFCLLRELIERHGLHQLPFIGR